MLEAFRDGVISGQCSRLNAAQTESANSEYGNRLATLNAHYLKALRGDRSLIHLGDKSALVVRASDDAALLVGQPIPLIVDVSDSNFLNNLDSVLWEQFVGPGQANFSDSTALEPSVTFSEIGTYLLQLTLIAGDITESATTTITIAVPPGPPTGLRATALDGRVILNWDDLPDSSGVTYKIYRASSTDNNPTILATNHTSSVFVDETASNGTTYSYLIKAMNSQGIESPFSDEVVATPEAASVPGEAAIFGTNHQGYAGFLQTNESAAEIWSIQTDSAQHRNQSTGFKNASLLRKFPMNRTDGNIYTIEGVVHLADGYADDCQSNAACGELHRRLFRLRDAEPFEELQHLG